MPPGDEVKQSVDRFFSAADGNQDSREKLGLSRELSCQTNGACDSLRALRDQSDDELFEKVADAIAKDPRITKHLPALALEALSSNGELGNGKDYRTNQKIDSDGDLAISKDEAAAAANKADSFDPVHQRALQFFNEKYESFRQLHRADGPLGYGDKSDDGHSSVTYQDLQNGVKRLFDKSIDKVDVQDNARLAALDKVISSFHAIDADGSGRISYTEGRKWLDKNQPPNRSALAAFLPTSNENRFLRGSTFLTLENLQATRKSLISERENTVPFFRVRPEE